MVDCWFIKVALMIVHKNNGLPIFRGCPAGSRLDWELLASKIRAVTKVSEEEKDGLGFSKTSTSQQLCFSPSWKELLLVSFYSTWATKFRYPLDGTKRSGQLGPGGFVGLLNFCSPHIITVL